MEKRSTYKIHESGKVGEVHIADEVIAVIAGLAATEVEGVASMAGNITNELVAKIGKRNLSKGVAVELADNTISVNLSLNIKYGYNVIEISGAVQDKVKAALENMTGFKVADVNVRIASVVTEKE